MTRELNAEREPSIKRVRQLSPWAEAPEDLSEFEGYKQHYISPVLEYLLKEYWGIQFPVTLRRIKESYEGNRGRGDTMTALSASLIGRLDRGCRFVFAGYFLTTPGMPEYCTQEYELSMGYQRLEKRTLENTWVEVALADSRDTYHDCPVMTVPDYEEVFPV